MQISAWERFSFIVAVQNGVSRFQEKPVFITFVVSLALMKVDRGPRKFSKSKHIGLKNLFILVLYKITFNLRKPQNSFFSREKNRQEGIINQNKQKIVTTEKDKSSQNDRLERIGQFFSTELRRPRGNLPGPVEMWLSPRYCSLQLYF